jgi:hypothetical protein
MVELALSSLYQIRSSGVAAHPPTLNSYSKMAAEI